MGAAADGHVLNRGDGRLLGVDHLQRRNAPPPELPPHDPGQRADGGVVDVRHLEGGGLHLIARPHGADDGRAAAVGLLDQLQLAGDGVNGVYDVVVPGKIKLIGGVGSVEGAVGVHHRVRVDLQNALPGHVDLVFAHGLAGGEDLAVQIGETHLVVVDQIQRAHAAAGQCLHCVAAHAADAEHRYPGGEKPLHGLAAHQQLRSGKLIQHF